MNITRPRTAEILKRHLYVDSLLSGTETIKEARTIKNKIIALLARGGFAIRRWVSNDERVINDLTTSVSHTNFALNADRFLKTLGITWSDDKIYYSIQPIKTTEKWTKRRVLSKIAKIYDSMDLLGPVILCAKKLMQDIWRCGLQWDEFMSQSTHSK